MKADKILENFKNQFQHKLKNKSFKIPYELYEKTNTNKKKKKVIPSNKLTK